MAKEQPRKAPYITEKTQITHGPNELEWALGVIGAQCIYFYIHPPHLPESRAFCVRLLGKLQFQAHNDILWWGWLAPNDVDHEIKNWDQITRFSGDGQKYQLVCGKYDPDQGHKERGWIMPCELTSTGMFAPFIGMDMAWGREDFDPNSDWPKFE